MVHQQLQLVARDYTDVSPHCWRLLGQESPFAQRMARTIVQLEVAVAHEGVDFQNMKVIVLPRLYTAINFSFCLLARACAWYSEQKTDPHCSWGLSELDKKSAARFAFECFARVRVSPPSQVVSKL
jgi:hypothetical protein